MVFVSLAMGCAASFPEVENDFEQNWQPTEFKASAYVIPTAPEALARRIALVRQARSNIDMTYFSWDKDLVGLLLLQEIKLAADRGVKVRLTLDDLLVFDEKWLADLDHHSNIEIRLFNPFSSRKTGWLGRVVDFAGNRSALDHRLHEKYFNVDQTWMILGGRNIGNAYFGYSTEANFFDMDVLFEGDILNAFAQNYQMLWDSELLSPISAVVATKQKRRYAHFSKALNRALMGGDEVLKAIDLSVQQLQEVTYTAITAVPVFDSVEKLDDSQPYFRSRLEHLLSEPLDTAEQVTISTPYVIPTRGEFKVIDALTKRSVEVELLTNSSSSNDSAFVPATYEQSREALLDKGVHILEYKDRALNDDHYFHADTYYHNKTVILDNKLTYIGSSNFDPRSDFLNIEFGVVIDSASFARDVEHYLKRQQDQVFWKVSRNDDGNTQWVSGDQVELKSPNYGVIHTLPDWVFRKLSIELEL
ncbi:phospholipase D family protein [Vibrio sp. SCSIO 43135]|uniref:phospholipase D family protein n=1 Tax=Vibrio sp. SCSIO 43135 TaxID=2819096 RepID=UPI00207647EF|nr:phospholipase D family protein [Vibrio sp. SCSIO 43135]USD44207.1 phospholipase D family protein [Vibrio sp. SCSIO 43135]